MWDTYVKARRGPGNSLSGFFLLQGPPRPIPHMCLSPRQRPPTSVNVSLGKATGCDRRHRDTSGHQTNTAQGRELNPTLGHVTFRFPFKVEIPSWVSH